jgi:CubicO group peptidase (beta-lactamase class C family)
MRDDSIFRIASQSKALTGVAIMALQEQGKLVIGDQDKLRALIYQAIVD